MTHDIECFQNALNDHLAGHLEKAEAGYRRILEAEPNHADSLHLLGLIESERGATNTAIELIRKAISIRDLALYQNNFGGVLEKSEDYASAERAYRRAIDLDPLDPTAHSNIGTLYINIRRFADAESFLRRAITLDPGLYEAHVNLGLILVDVRQWPEAETLLRRALALRPDRLIVHRHLGRLMVLDKRFFEAEVLFRRAIELCKEDAASHAGLAAALAAQGRDEEATEAAACALSIDPHCVDAHINRGVVLSRAERSDEAEASMRKALEKEPGNAIASFNLSTLLLKDGRFEEGWCLHESRNALGGEPELRFDNGCQPWKGEALTGRTLVVLCEQGFGDMLQFCRYLQISKELAPARLTVYCPLQLKRLFEAMEGVDVIVMTGNPQDIPLHDFWCYVMSLPFLLGTTLDTIPGRTPYLRAPATALARWSARMPSSGFKVGVVWAGDPRPHQADAHLTDKRRSLHAKDFEPLLKIDGASFVSLQVGASTRPQIDEIDSRWRPLDFMDEVTDFADTAAIIEGLDLVISVDTSTAHLAGALNCPVWILSRFDGCWRWLKDRSDSPWYPSARLFRQQSPGAWDEVIGRVAHALREEIARAQC
jgi:Flp pilus assembly protein TadD